jgi:hypothetical protein
MLVGSGDHVRERIALVECHKPRLEVAPSHGT